MSVSTHQFPQSGVRENAAIHRFLERLFPSPRHFEICLYDGTRLESSGTPRFTLMLNSPGALRRMLRPPLELSVGEAFISGDFDIKGDIVAAINLLITMPASLSGKLPGLVRSWLTLPGESSSRRELQRESAHLNGSYHSRERDRTAVQYHYDVSNDFYALWLDKRMVYSCAYFPIGTETIDEAQEQKLELICRKLQLKPGETLLDVGCGWGGLMIYAAQKYGVKALGVTLSQQQHDLASQRIAAADVDGAVKLLDYRDLKGQVFDKIVSIGMYEHVGRKHLPEYFSQLYQLLKPGGLFLNHGIAMNYSTTLETLWSRLVDRYVIGKGQFFDHYIFPDSDIIAVSEVNTIAEKTGFEVRHVENLREHYARTLRHWLARLESNHDEVVRLTGEHIYRTWRLYMAAGVNGFEMGRLSIHQTILYKQPTV